MGTEECGMARGAHAPRVSPTAPSRLARARVRFRAVAITRAPPKFSARARKTARGARALPQPTSEFGLNTKVSATTFSTAAGVGRELGRRPKGDAATVNLARRLRVETRVTLKWLAARLWMPSGSNVSDPLTAARVKECKK